MVSTTRAQRAAAVAVAVWAAAAVATVAANDVRFANKCAFPIALYNLADHEPRAPTAIESGAVWTSANVSGYNYYRHGDSAEATVVSLRFDPVRGSSYDVSIIPPQALYCSSFETCRDEARGQRGFNVPVQILPEPAATTASRDRCAPITCGADDATRCRDGFLFPADSVDKYKLCGPGQSFQLVFCPDGPATAISSVDASSGSGGSSSAGKVLPGSLRESGSRGGPVVANDAGTITFAQVTPSMVPAPPTSMGFDAIAADGATGAAAVVAPGSA